MSTTEIELYELLKVKLGERETKALFEVVDHKFDSKKDELATKLDIEHLKLEIEKVLSEVTISKWMLGVVITGILALILKTFLLIK